MFGSCPYMCTNFYCVSRSRKRSHVLGNNCLGLLLNIYRLLIDTAVGWYGLSATLFEARIFADFVKKYLVFTFPGYNCVLIRLVSRTRQCTSSENSEKVKAWLPRWVVFNYFLPKMLGELCMWGISKTFLLTLIVWVKSEKKIIFRWRKCSSFFDHTDLILLRNYSILMFVIHLKQS